MLNMQTRHTITPTNLNILLKYYYFLLYLSPKYFKSAEIGNIKPITGTVKIPPITLKKNSSSKIKIGKITKKETIILIMTNFRIFI